MSPLLVLLRKEWEDAFRNRMVLFTLLFTPIVLVVVAIGSMLPLGLAQDELTEQDMQEIAGLAKGLCEGVTPQDCLPLYMASLMMLMFLVLPTALPSVIAAYGIVGEKNERTLEPLLATPIRTIELLSAKVAAAVIPAMLATWLAAALFLVLLSMSFSAEVARAVLSPAWLAALLLLAPLLAIASVLIATMVSSRSTDPRSAQQVASLVVVPVVGVLVAQSLGVLVIQPAVVLPAVVILVGVDVVLAYFALQLFERETILTRWTGL